MGNTNELNDINSGKRKSFIEYILLNFLVLVVLIWALQLWNANLFKYPLEYANGNESLTLAYFQTLLEEGPIANSSRLSAPYPVEALDIYDGKYLTHCFRWIIAKIFNNSVATSNILFCLGFFMVANTSYFVLKKIGISQKSSFVGAILYAFVPSHFYRGMQQFDYSIYWQIPLIIYYILSYMNSDNLFSKERKTLLNKKNIFHIIVLVIIGSSGAYYVYFSCFLFLIIILYKLLKKEKICEVIFNLVFIICVFILNCIPIISSIIKYGYNSLAISTVPQDIEAYSLKIVSFFIPVDMHRISLFSGLKKLYRYYPLTNDNYFNVFGLFMSIGFICLILEILKLKHSNKTIQNCSILNICAILFGTIGSFASLISAFFIGISAYNRISIYIAFFALIAATALLDTLLKKFNSKFFQNVFIVVILCLGLLDQVSEYFIPDYKNIKKIWDTESQFISQIESMEEEGAMIYQLPYVSYPNGKAFAGSDLYNLHLLGFLHSNKVKWSYGGYSGRLGDVFCKSISELSLNTQLKYLAEYNFAGIYLNKDLFQQEDSFNLKVNELKSITGVEPIVSEDNNLYYFTLKNYKSITKTVNKYNINIFHDFSDGFYSEETLNGNYWNWCSGSGVLKLYNISDKNEKINLSMYIHTLSEGIYNLEIKLNQQQQSVKLNQNDYISFDLILEPGENLVEFNSDVPSVVKEDDSRELAFSVENLIYQPKN